jgi:hypothetical protein
MQQTARHTAAVPLLLDARRDGMSRTAHSVMALVVAILAPWRFPRASAAPAADDAILRQLERRWPSIQSPKTGLGVRELFAFGLEAAAADWHPERIEKAYALAATMQDRDAKSKTYGNLAWRYGDKGPDDLNAVEFCMHHGALTWMLYKDRLSPAARASLDELIRFGLEGVRRRGCKPDYTNIFLMHCWNLLAIGEATGRPDAFEEGVKFFDDWLAWTAKNGITEYLSPTYYGVDLDCLGFIARHIRDAAVKKKAEVALRYLWTDIAANWFEPGLRLGGAHSRDYDYLTGHGVLDRHLQMAGWLPEAPPYRAFETLARWAPPSDLRAAFDKQVPRVVCQRWLAKPWAAAVHYRGRAVDIGFGGGCKGSEDKVFTFQFAGGPKQVVGNFVMEGRLDPYGVNKTVTGGGHMKSHHLSPFVAGVQRGLEVLMLVSDAPKSKPGNPEWTLTGLYSHIVFPADAQPWSVDKALEPPEGGTERDVADAAVFLRSGDAAVGLRVLLAVDTAGKPAPFRWANDGVKQGAMRLTCVHAATDPQGRGTLVLWARAAEGLDDARFAAFRRDFAKAEGTVTAQGDRVDAAVAGLKGRMHIQADVAKKERLVREGGETAAEDCLLWVDGKDWGKQMLGEPVSGRETQ